MDAGRVQFVAGANINLNLANGFKNTDIYCVAPTCLQKWKCRSVSPVCVYLFMRMNASGTCFLFFPIQHVGTLGVLIDSWLTLVLFWCVSCMAKGHGTFEALRRYRISWHAEKWQHVPDEQSAKKRRRRRFCGQQSQIEALVSQCTSWYGKYPTIYIHGFIQPRWCRISSINRMTLVGWFAISFGQVAPITVNNAALAYEAQLIRHVSRFMKFYKSWTQKCILLVVSAQLLHQAQHDW